MASKDESIVSQVALKAAVEYAKVVEADVLETAQTYYDWLEQFLPGGTVNANPSPAPKRRSSGRASRSRSSANGSNGGFTIKDPDAPATKSQIGKLLSMTDDYTWEEAEEFTKGEISSLIDSLN